MLTPILATDDPYQSAAVFVSAGWSLVFQTPADRPHKGAGVEFHLTVPADDIAAVFDSHCEHAESVTDLTRQPWGELAFHSVLLGYKFLIAAEAGSKPDHDGRPGPG